MELRGIEFSREMKTFSKEIEKSKRVWTTTCEEKDTR